MKTKSSVTNIIDDVYKKERRYITNTDKDNFINYKSPIFDLQRFHNIMPKGTVLNTIDDTERYVKAREINQAAISPNNAPVSPIASNYKLTSEQIVDERVL